MASQSLFGKGPNQIPRNSDLGNIAFQNSDFLRVTKLSSDFSLAVGKTVASHAVDVVGDVNSTGVLRINGSQILSTTSLANTVVNSSLTSVGNITTGTWSASFGAVSGANLTNLTAGNLTGTITPSVLGNSTLFVGTTPISLNRVSSNLSFTGITSIQ